MTPYIAAPIVRTAVRLEPRVIDASPHLLEASYRLRYQVYCLERQFLDPAAYPTGLEVDAFDPCSVHVGAVDEDGRLAGTARLVMCGALGLPLFRRLSVTPEYAWLCDAPTVAEISRLSISRSYERWQAGAHQNDGERHARARRRAEGEIFLTITRALYHASKGLGVTHWLAATEKSLYRILLRFGLPFRAAGPECDYYGMVAPYLMEIAELDCLIASGGHPRLDDFADGLERPRRAAHSSAGDAQSTACLERP